PLAPPPRSLAAGDRQNKKPVRTASVPNARQAAADSLESAVCTDRSQRFSGSYAPNGLQERGPQALSHFHRKSAARMTAHPSRFFAEPAAAQTTAPQPARS